MTDRIYPMLRFGVIMSADLNNTYDQLYVRFENSPTLEEIIFDSVNFQSGIEPETKTGVDDEINNEPLKEKSSPKSFDLEP